MGAAESKEVVSRFVNNFPTYTKRALDNDDPKELAVDLTDDFFWVMPDSMPRAGKHQGMPAILEFLKQGMGLFEAGTMKNEIIGMVAEDDYVAVRIRCTGRSMKGRDYNGMYHCLFRVRDGKVCELWDFADTLHSWQAIYAD
jgi:ketosteroid isomerase-like protein